MRVDAGFASARGSSRGRLEKNRWGVLVAQLQLRSSMHPTKPKETAMNGIAQTKRFVVLAAVDESEFAPAVVRAAVNLTESVSGGELHLVRAVGLQNELDATRPVRAGREYLEAMMVEARKLCAGRVTGHLSVGGAAHEILQLAARLNVDLLVLGTHGRKGIQRLLLGSVAEHVVRGASCPVMVVREKNYRLGLAPEVEPPCANCVKTQAVSGGARLWCAHHSGHHPKAHTYSETPTSFAVGSSIIRPET